MQSSFGAVPTLLNHCSYNSKGKKAKIVCETIKPLGGHRSAVRTWTYTSESSHAAQNKKRVSVTHSAKRHYLQTRAARVYYLAKKTNPYVRCYVFGKSPSNLEKARLIRERSKVAQKRNWKHVNDNVRAQRAATQSESIEDFSLLPQRS